MSVLNFTLSDISEALNEIVENGQHGCEIVRIGVFGSVARGEAEAESDLDFIIGYQRQNSSDSDIILDVFKKRIEFETTLRGEFSPIKLSIVSEDAVNEGMNENFADDVYRDVVWIYEQ